MIRTEVSGSRQKSTGVHICLSRSKIALDSQDLPASWARALRRGKIAGSPQRCSSSAGKPKIALVKLGPLNGSPNICTSSMTPTYKATRRLNGTP